jgi:hypothetical protein
VGPLGCHPDPARCRDLHTVAHKHTRMQVGRDVRVPLPPQAMLMPCGTWRAGQHTRLLSNKPPWQAACPTQ